MRIMRRDSHLLSHDMLEEIRFLLNLEMDPKSSCSLILIWANRIAFKTEIANTPSDRRQITTKAAYPHLQQDSGFYVPVCYNSF